MSESAAAAPAPAGKKEKKKPPANLKIPPKKPKLTKAQRRALQEQQRAAKAAGSAGGGGGKKGGGQQQQQQQQQQQGQHQKKGQQQQQQQQQSSSSDASKSKQNQKANAEPSKSGKEEEKKEDDRTMDIFSHLSNYHELPNPHAPEWTSTLHPAVIELGMQYASGSIRGGQARCRSMLTVFLQVFDDYEPPKDTSDYRSHLDHMVLKPSFTFWTKKCRQHCVSMGNAFTFCKVAVASLDRDLSWEQAKEILQDTLERYMQERMDIANQAITEHAMTKIANGDVILTFGNSHAIRVLLTTAKKEGLDFYVWVVDSRPLFEGKDMLAALQDAGISCGYIQLNALTFVMKQITKVFLGASALMSNGAVFGRVGTACVAMLANDSHIPVLVCCETYKISNKVQLESITHNELGNPDALTELPEGPAFSCLSDWKETKNLKLLNLMYDVTPPDFVSGIITEVGIIPSTSVAVLLREMNPQDAAY
mmetsp:Transcript_10874/g.26299  ORF Transcript_10874/g.26299 Transcript_10874/m.26299 type:complete len:479 (-) Transcript_10874:36-1472(-)|eukprot:CAMPEP_0113626982 /NCGR_PEP_ID=MMETSP0017_2-20120614/13963_1 /TAXON_ID=2856 /ORGANISM="Cylindrotheca closterium" /LENGTH=478 /DNA_ID=CAMNT_0000537199 /DNA_START=33 /DNA_END=1469 /DNA_ORIENTATION=+ /assembly_acc=CAM_ASM_000147